jgi:putative ABC transport system substrate-binding protein
MKRRKFITLLGGAAAAWPLAARAQQGGADQTHWVCDGLGDGIDARLRFQAFREGLEALGWVEGRNPSSMRLSASLPVVK